jgi:hypothetical protein
MRRTYTRLAIGLAVVVVLTVPAIASAQASDPGLVARKLGSPDPRDTAGQNSRKVQSASVSTTSDPGVVARKLGSPDPRDTDAATKSSFAPSIAASMLGSADPRDTARDSLLSSSVVATTLGEPDVRDAAQIASPISSTPASGFHWGDFGIGVALGVGMAAALAGFLILAAAVTTGRKTRRAGPRPA